MPIFPEDLQKMRTKSNLVNEGQGPEVSLTLACRRLNECIRELEYRKDATLRNEIRSARNTLHYLQHLLGSFRVVSPEQAQGFSRCSHLSKQHFFLLRQRDNVRKRL